MSFILLGLTSCFNIDPSRIELKFEENSSESSDELFSAGTQTFLAPVHFIEDYLSVIRPEYSDSLFLEELKRLTVYGLKVNYLLGDDHLTFTHLTVDIFKKSYADSVKKAIENERKTNLEKRSGTFRIFASSESYEDQSDTSFTFAYLSDFVLDTSNWRSELPIDSSIVVISYDSTYEYSNSTNPFYYKTYDCFTGYYSFDSTRLVKDSVVEKTCSKADSKS